MILPLTVTRPVRVASFSRARLQGASGDSAVTRNERGDAANDERAPGSSLRDLLDERTPASLRQRIRTTETMAYTDGEETDVEGFDSGNAVHRLRQEAEASPVRVLAGATAFLSHAAGIHLGI